MKTDKQMGIVSGRWSSIASQARYERGFLLNTDEKTCCASRSLFLYSGGPQMAPAALVSPTISCTAEERGV